MSFGAAQFLVDLLMVDHIVAVSAAGRRLQVRGAIKMTDAQLGKIVGNCRDFGKTEAGVELKRDKWRAGQWTRRST